MRYRTSFQCPDTGQTIIAHYAFGKVTFSAVSEDGEEIEQETYDWVKKYTNHRSSTAILANHYLLRVSEGQSMGFDEVD